MRTLTRDVRHIASVRALQRYIQFVFDFPDYYGRNLDALHDMLCSLGDRTHIVLITGEEQSAELSAYLPRLERVLLDAARENGKLSFERVQGV